MRARVQEVDGEIMAAEDEILKLQQLNVCLMEQNPEIKTAVEIAVAKERQSHEERNAKVLQLLSAKVVFPMQYQERYCPRSLVRVHTLLLALHPTWQFMLRLCATFLGGETKKIYRCATLSLEMVLGYEFD